MKKQSIIQSVFSYFIPAFFLGLPVWGLPLVIMGFLVLLFILVGKGRKKSEIVSFSKFSVILILVHLVVNAFLFFLYHDAPRGDFSQLIPIIVCAWIILFIASIAVFRRIEWYV